MKNAGIVLIVIGLALTVFTAFTFFTEKKVLDIGQIELTKEEPHSVNWSPLLGIAVIGAGALVYWQGAKKA